MDHLLGSVIEMWVDRMDNITQPERRKLSALALLSLLPSDNRWETLIIHLSGEVYTIQTVYAAAVRVPASCALEEKMAYSAFVLLHRTQLALHFVKLKNNNKYRQQIWTHAVFVLFTYAQQTISVGAPGVAPHCMRHSDGPVWCAFIVPTRSGFRCMWEGAVYSSLSPNDTGVLHKTTYTLCLVQIMIYWCVQNDWWTFVKDKRHLVLVCDHIWELNFCSTNVDHC